MLLREQRRSPAMIGNEEADDAPPPDARTLSSRRVKRRQRDEWERAAQLLMTPHNLYDADEDVVTAEAMLTLIRASAIHALRCGQRVLPAPESVLQAFWLTVTGADEAATRLSLFGTPYAVGWLEPPSRTIGLTDEIALPHLLYNDTAVMGGDPNDIRLLAQSMLLMSNRLELGMRRRLANSQKGPRALLRTMLWPGYQAHIAVDPVTVQAEAIPCYGILRVGDTLRVSMLGSANVRVARLTRALALRICTHPQRPPSRNSLVSGSDLFSLRNLGDVSDLSLSSLMTLYQVIPNHPRLTAQAVAR